MTDVARRQRESAGLIRAASRYLTLLSRAAGDAPHAAMLADRDAVVIDARCGDARLGDLDATTSVRALRSAARSMDGVTTVRVGRDGGEVVWHGVPIVAFDGAAAGTLCVVMRADDEAPNPRALLAASARGIGASLLAERLRARVDEVVLSDARGAETLERLRQDLMQSYTAGHLGLELAALRPEGARHTADLVRDTFEAIELFEHLSTTWLLLASSRADARRVSPGELVRDVFALLRVDAMTRGVELRLTAAEGPSVEVPVGDAARGLVARTESALRAAGPGGRVEVSSTPEGRVTWTILPDARPLASMGLDLRRASR